MLKYDIILPVSKGKPLSRLRRVCSTSSEATLTTSSTHAFNRSYQNPLVTRYASTEILYNFSPEHQFQTWRHIWITLAEAERELGLPINQAQINELKHAQHLIDYQKAARYETTLKHEIMAHIRLYGEQCPKAKPIIHLGATSALITDNADLIISREALLLIKVRLVNLIHSLTAFTRRYQDLPILGLTHLQPALLTTVGKRASLWLNDLLMDLHHLEFLESQLKLLGAKGAIGTQASFLALFNGNRQKVLKLDRLFTRKLGFEKSYPVTGQTYPRKLDYQILSLLSGLAQSASKFSNDLRLLQSRGEITEVFTNEQVGSSAMAYKRNPVRAERIVSLARFVMTLAQNAAFTSAHQWLERTLDDSANRRLVIPEAFLATDGLLDIYLYLVDNLTVYPEIINQHIRNELPFLITETILMEGVKAGGDRQELHERIRQHAQKAYQRVSQGLGNDLIERIRHDPAFRKISPRLDTLLDPRRHLGLASNQVFSFIRSEINPILKKYRTFLGQKPQLRV